MSGHSFLSTCVELRILEMATKSVFLYSIALKCNMNLQQSVKKKIQFLRLSYFEKSEQFLQTSVNFLNSRCMNFLRMHPIKRLIIHLCITMRSFALDIY
jgi:hypothetical protein